MRNIRLPTLAARFWGESDLILSRFSHTFPDGHDTCSQLHVWTQEMCVIRLQDAWARFCRELVLVSASGRPLTAGGSRLGFAPGIRRRADAQAKLRTVYTRSPWEPKWFDAQACLRAANILGLANYSAISSGIGVTPSPLDDLRDLRNFLAHRSDLTAADVRTVALAVHLPAKTDVITILQGSSASPGMTVLQLWTKQLQTMAQIAVR